MDHEAISHAPDLKVIARAGVGLDNVDISAATEAGVMVVNAPTSNIVSAAELAISHLLALARNIPRCPPLFGRGGVEALAVLRRSSCLKKPSELLAWGRIGALVAERLSGFGAQLIGFDPYVQPGEGSGPSVSSSPRWMI